MRDYYKSTKQELYGERLKLKNEIERIDHVLGFMEVSETTIKTMLWERYLLFKKEVGMLLVVKYKGGNSCDPKMYEYYEAEKITDSIYETEITKDYLFWLNNNQQYLDAPFNWL